jgi:hypothetical protein
LPKKAPPLASGWRDLYRWATTLIPPGLWDRVRRILLTPWNYTLQNTIDTPVIHLGVLEQALLLF